MQSAKNLTEYKNELKGALDNDFLRKAMDNFAVAYRGARVRAFTGMDVDALVNDIANAKDAAVSQLEELYEQFKEQAEKVGVTVHRAATAQEANEIIARIAEEENCKVIVKSKSMTAEETLLNHHLEARDLEVVETDLGEWIIQLRHEGPTHMVMPAIHLSRHQVADLFSGVTQKEQDAEIEKLVKVARRELRAKYATADMGISGANFCIAETGSIGLVTNEGNARLVTTLPRVHVALAGLDKLTPTLSDALRILKALPRNATGQQITSYVTWITGANECAAPGLEDTKKKMHIVFLDNGRSALAKDKDFSQVLRCVRCGACANVCPVYRLVGGHQMGHIYIGAIGLILTYFFHGREAAKNLVQNCINCGACKHVCAAGIDLPRLIKDVHARILDEEGHPAYSTLLGKVLSNRKLFHTLLRTAKLAQRPVKTKSGFLRHLPMIFDKSQNFRALPAIASTPFRDRWKSLRTEVKGATMKVALFSGCVQDFVYPEQMEAAFKVLSGRNIQCEFPMGQSCCGLPAQMMGETKAAAEVAKTNMNAIDPADYDYILTTCASCASHLKHAYPKLGAGLVDPVKAEQFAAKVVDFSSFARDVLGLDANSFAGKAPEKKTAYHSPCHLCRGMDVIDQPRELMKDAGVDYVETEEEDVCCGFGGSFSMKFPELSAETLNRKLARVEEAGATEMLTDCPGCVMQLRGGAERRGKGMTVRHIAEALAERLK